MSYQLISNKSTLRAKLTEYESTINFTTLSASVLLEAPKTKHILIKSTAEIADFPKILAFF